MEHCHKDDSSIRGFGLVFHLPDHRSLKGAVVRMQLVPVHGLILVLAWKQLDYDFAKKMEEEMAFLAVLVVAVAAKD